MLQLPHCNAQYIKKSFCPILEVEFFWNQVNLQVQYMKTHGKQSPMQMQNYYFIKSFVIAVRESPKAVHILEELGGKIHILTDQSQTDLKYLCNHHKLSYNSCHAVSHDGHNILYGSFIRLPKSNQNPFEKKLKHLHTEISNIAKNLFQDSDTIPYIKSTYMVSKLVTALPSVPQVAHTDFDASVCQCAYLKSGIAVTPTSKEGLMLLVWTNDTHTK